MKVDCQISLGELIDKLSILEIKLEKISDPTKLASVEKERDVLANRLSELDIDHHNFLAELKQVNGELWDIEDAIREKERVKLFDQDFIEIARSVYLTNDRRFEIKDSINRAFGSEIVEVKSYQKY